MIRFSFEDRTVEVADCWEEVTVEHFITPGFMTGNPIELLATLSGVNPKQLANTTEDLTEHYGKIVQFMKDKPNGWQGTGKAEDIEILDVLCKIPKNIEMEMFGQKIMLGAALQSKTYVYEAMPDVMAIYLGPQIYPDDWFKRIDEIANAIKPLPINKVYPIATFFLTHLS